MGMNHSKAKTFSYRLARRANLLANKFRQQGWDILYKPIYDSDDYATCVQLIGIRSGRQVLLASLGRTWLTMPHLYREDV